MKTQLYTVCPVFVTRRYGGPEEGGWYWDHVLPLYHDHWSKMVRVFTDYQEAIDYGNEAYEAIAYRNEELPPLDSVASVGRYSVNIFEGFPQETPTPHYE